MGGGTRCARYALCMVQWVRACTALPCPVARPSNARKAQERQPVAASLQALVRISMVFAYTVCCWLCRRRQRPLRTVYKQTMQILFSRLVAAMLPPAAAAVPAGSGAGHGPGL